MLDAFVTAYGCTALWPMTLMLIALQLGSCKAYKFPSPKCKIQNKPRDRISCVHFSFLRTSRRVQSPMTKLSAKVKAVKGARGRRCVASGCGLLVDHLLLVTV